MKNKILKLTLLFTVISIIGVKAQSFNKGQVDIDAGIGFGSNFLGVGPTTSLPPIGISVDYGITENISIGGYFGIAGDRWTYSFYDYCGNGYPYTNVGYYNVTAKWTFIIIGVRGAYHFAKLINNDKIDVYAGLMLGDNIASISYSTSDPCPGNAYYYSGSAYGGFAWSIFAGARYRFTDHFGVFAELGYGIDIFTIGINFRL